MLEKKPEAERLHLCEHELGVIGHGERRFVLVTNAETAAEIDSAQGKAVRLQFPHQSRQPNERALEGHRVSDLAPDVTSHPLHLEM